MKILFYLPVVTQWWFVAIVTPMIRALYGVAELHIIVAKPWRNTGLTEAEVAPLMDMPAINWHIVNAECHVQFRYGGSTVPGLIDLVKRINPDLTLCRSAEQNTPAQFPGVVRYLMESGAAPFGTDPHWIVLAETLFLHGAMPDKAAEVGAYCADRLEPLFAAARAGLAYEPEQGWRKAFDLPADRRILAVPLQYEHEEDFFVEHGRFARSVDLLAWLLREMPDDTFLAVTDHPLNRLYVDRGASDAFIAQHPDKARLCLQDGLPQGPTGLITSRADAVVIDQSKCWSLAAFSGTPIIHIGNTAMAPWLHANVGNPSAASALTRPDTDAARRWFGWHLGTRLLNPYAFTLPDLIARICGDQDETVIHPNLEMVLQYAQGASQ